MDKIAFKLITISLILMTFLVSGCSSVLNQDPEVSCDFVQNSNRQRVSWKLDLPLKFRVHKGVPKIAYDSIKRAADKWNKISTKSVIKIIKWDSEISPENGYSDGAPTIYWLKSWEKGRKNEQARTTVVWSKDKLKDADIKINSKDYTFNFDEEGSSDDKVDFESLMVHEMGHALGFAHSDEKKSVMYPRLASGKERRVVSELSDLESYTCEYGEEIVKKSVLTLALNRGTVLAENEKEEEKEKEKEKEKEVADVDSTDEEEISPESEQDLSSENDVVTQGDEVSSTPVSTSIDESLI